MQLSFWSDTDYKPGGFGRLSLIPEGISSQESHNSTQFGSICTNGTRHLENPRHQSSSRFSDQATPVACWGEILPASLCLILVSTAPSHRQNQGTQTGLRSVCHYHRGRFPIQIIVLELALKFWNPSHVSWHSPHLFPAFILKEIKFYRHKRSTLRMDARFIYSNYAQWKVSISTNLIDILLWTWLGEKKSTKGDFTSQLTLTKKKTPFVDLRIFHSSL